jgi:hypothetical protein
LLYKISRVFVDLTGWIISHRIATPVVSYTGIDGSTVEERHNYGHKWGAIVTDKITTAFYVVTGHEHTIGGNCLSPNSVIVITFLLLLKVRPLEMLVSNIRYQNGDCIVIKYKAGRWIIYYYAIVRR